jgi:hypothetical protein
MIALMQLEEAQADVLRIYRGGFSGPLVSSLIWLASAATYQWTSPGAAMAVLFLGGMLIFPLATLVLKIMSGRAFLPKGHPSTPLAIQSVHGVQLEHRGFGEVAAFAGLPLVVLLGQDRPGQAQQRRGVGEFFRALATRRNPTTLVLSTPGLTVVGLP